MTRRAATSLVALLCYAAISFAYFGWRLLPHPGRYLVGSGRDPELFVWVFAWWPHAIGSWTNPFVSHAVYAPTGINLAWTTSVPALALAFAPLTVAFGPTVSYNVACVVVPALGAWTAFLLFRYLTRSTWASLVGGYLFGFSSFVLGHQLGGHLNLTATFVLPLLALVVVRRVRGELDTWPFVWRLGALLALQLAISTEVAATATLVLALGLALAYALVPEARGGIASALPPIGMGYAFAAVLAAPLVYYALTGFVRGSFGDPPFFSADLLNFVVPTHVIGVGGTHFASVAARFPGNDDERGAYLGLALLAMIALYALRVRRSAVARFLLAALLLSALLALGTALHVEGRRLIALPWRLTSHVPGLDNALPGRLSVYVSLAAATIAALWIATTRGRFYPRPYVLPVLAVLGLVPAFWHTDYRLLPERWPFFTQGQYKECIPRGETVAVFPYGFWGDSMLWQAETGFRFRMAGGYLRYTPPKAYLADPTVFKLTYEYTNDPERPTMTELLGFARRHRVGRILSVEIHAYPDGTQMHSFGVLQLDGGVLIAPACGYPALPGGRG